MRILFLICCFTLLQLHAKGQSLQLKWAYAAGSNMEDHGISVISDAWGNVYSTGYFSGTVDFDRGPGYHILSAIDSFDAYILKQDINGNFLWVITLGSVGEEKGFNLALDNINNLYVSGTFENTVDFDPGPSVFNLTSTGVDHGSFLLKLNASGGFIWAVAFNSSQFRGLKTDVGGNIYLAGSYSRTVDFDPGPGVYNLNSVAFSQDIVFLKIDPSGNLIWVKQIGSDDQDYATTISIDNSGNLIITGMFSATADFDPGPSVFNVNAQFWDVFILKLDNAANFLWAKTITGPSQQLPGRSSLDLNGNILMPVRFLATTDFDPGPSTYIVNPVYNYDAAICKLDANGNFVWVKQIGGAGPDYVADVTVDYLGNIYATGGFLYSVDFDPGPGIHMLNSNGEIDLFILKYNPAGDFLWATHLGGSNSDGATDIHLDENLNIFITGGFRETVDFDPGPALHSQPAIGYIDAYTLKLSQCLTNTDSTITTTACNNYTLNGQLYTATGIYTQVIQNSTGCDSTITLDLTISGFSDYDTISACENFVWHGQTYINSGNYSLSYSGSNGCDSNFYLNLTITPVIRSFMNQSICQGESYYGHTASGVYMDTFTAANGCDSIRTVSLTVFPVITTIVNASVCEGDTMEGYTIGGTYIDTFSSANGCDSIRRLNLLVYPSPRVSQEVSICQGSSYFAGGTYQTTSGVYRDTFLTNFGCDSVITTNLTVNPNPQPDLGPDRGICMNSIINLTPGAFSSYIWHDQATGRSHSVSDTGIYFVNVTNQFNCQASDTVVITELFSPPSNFLQTTDSICQYESKLLQPALTFTDYLWSTGSRNSYISIDQPGIFSLQVTDNNGCIGKDSISVVLKKCLSGLFAPTAFTPNNDGKNDQFRALLFGDVKKYELTIYNRWGQVVYKTTNPSKGWDGTLNGRKQENGVYVWVCGYQLNGSSEKMEKGTVLLLK